MSQKAKTIVITPFTLHLIAVILTLIAYLSYKAYGTVIPSGYGYEIIQLFLVCFMMLAWLFVAAYWINKIFGEKG